MYSIGVDIGGMSIKVGIVDKNGNIIAEGRDKTATTSDLCIDNFIKRIYNLLSDNKISLNQIDGIGIGCPGAVNGISGIVEFLPNLGWYNVPLAEILNKEFNLPIKLSNDANVAVLAETLFGAAKGLNNAVMFTLGTGVGGGVVIDGKLYEGGSKKGAELGHVVLKIDGEPCTCGRKGCIETFVSATAFIKQTKSAMLLNKDSLMWEKVDGDIEKVDGLTAFSCAKLNDKTALEVVNKYVEYLSESIMSMLNIFRPEAFILGGGISLQGEYLTDKIVEYLERFEYGYKSAPKTKILTAKLGNDAGIIGAAALI